jgi:two-component system cell cycle sensor histidine kinase/response regulator CckA
MRLRYHAARERAYRILKSRTLRFAAAAALVFVGLAVRAMLPSSLGSIAPHLPLILAIIVSARLWGRGPGCAAAVLSVFIGDWWIADPQHIMYPHTLLRIAVSLGFTLLIAWLVGGLQAALSATAQARESLRHQNQLLNLANDAIITMDADRRVVGWNAGACAMYGYTEGEAIGRNVHRLLQTTCRVLVAEIDRIVDREGRWEGELDQTTLNGRRLKVESRHVLWRDERNQPKGLLQINRDISERKRAEEALRQSEERLRLVVEAADLGTWEWDIASGQLKWSDRSFALFGLQPGTPMTFDRFMAALYPEDRESVQSGVRQTLESGGDYRVEVRAVLPDGSLHWLSARGRAYRDESGRPVRMSGVVLDISEMKAAMAALSESESRYRALFETMQEAFVVGEIVRDAEGKFVDWRYLQVNPVFERWSGRTREELIGRSYREVFRAGDADRWVADYGSVAVSGKPGRWERYSEVLQRHVEAAVYSPGPGQFATVITDVTARKEAEERLRRQQKLESIGLLAGGVAHDFNNLLTVILGTASAALDQGPSREQAMAIVSAAERAADLTRQLLAYAGKGKVVVQSLNLTDIVSNSRQLLEASIPKRVKLAYRLHKELPPIEEDASRIEQILMNLAINASEAIQPNTDGHIEISTGFAEIMPEEAGPNAGWRAPAPGQFAWLEVKDNGAGMDEGTRSRIFDPFFTTKFTGRGLGLAAVDGIVRSAGGFIDVRSAPGQGTAFRVHLPVSEKAREPQAANLPRPRREAPPSAVLIVDDEDLLRQLASATLQRRGYETLEASTGKEALSKLAEADPLPSLVLLDLAMPEMGGDELIPILAEQYPGLKIVVSSGYPEEEVQKKYESGLVAGFLQKPYTVAALADKVDEVVSGRKPGGGSVIEFPRAS